jgi:membrane protein
MAGIIDSMKWTSDALAARWREPLAEALATLSTWPWLDTARTLRQRFREDRLGVTASSLTFTTTIALVPLFTVMLAVFSAFPIFASFQGALEKYFLQTLVPETIARPVLMTLNQFAAKASGLGLVGLVFLVLTALALMLTIDRTLNNIWRVRRSRPIGQRVAIYWAATTLGPLLLGVSLTFTSYALSASKGLVGALPGGVAALVDALEFALLALAMTALFRFVPNTPVRWCHAAIGGVFVALGLEVAKRLLAWYVRQMPSYAAVYGAFATLPIFLVWIYLGWVVVLLGAVIAAYAPSLSMHLLRRAETPGHRFAIAVALLRELLVARRSGTRGLDSAALAQRLRTDPLQVDPLLDALVALDWVGRLDEAGAARYVLLADPDVTRAEPLLTQLLLDPGAALRGFWQRAGFGELSLGQLLEG